jgi:uncharacterized spore protein YtfJ
VPGGTVVVFVLSVLVLLRLGTRARAIGGGFGISAPLWARRRSEEGDTVDEKSARERVTAEAGRMIGVIAGAEEISRALERAGSGEGAVGAPVAVGDRTVIPLIETFASGGFGGGSGLGTDGGNEGSGAGGGGGGIGRSRAIAIADVGPDGVKVRPVVDLTGLALPAVSALAALLMRGAGRRRRRRR